MNKPKINYIIDLLTLVSFLITALSGLAIKLLIIKNKTMKKMSLVVLLLMFGLVIQTQAASTNANQNSKSGQSDTSAGITTQGSAIQTNEQNAIKNQGEVTQIQTQEKNTVQTQNNTATDETTKNNNSNSSQQKRSQVADAVQTMLQIAERNGGIGQQVRVIAQTQNQNQAKLDQNIEKIQSRSGFAKFFIGPNYGEIKDAQKTLEQNKEQIRQLNQIRTQLSNQGDRQQLTEQIRILEQANQDIETSLSNAQKGFSLFGWLNNLLS